MSSPMMYKILDRFKSPDCFVSWIFLAVSVVSVPTYLIVRAYGMAHGDQVGEILILLLLCIISTYIGVYMFEMFIERDISAGSLLAGMGCNIEEDAGADAILEYEQYLRKINSLNDGHYVEKDGVLTNYTYSRSSNHIFLDS